MITLAVDCMGGDHGPSVTLPACRRFLDEHPDAALLLVGLPDALASLSHARCRVVAASEVVGMEDPIEVALRRKKDSSMRVAIQQVKDGAAQAAVSAGNTGALMAVARYLLKTLDGIDRPAIATQIPNAKGGATTVLDLGANVDCTAEHLLQFAVMGSALVSVLNDDNNPSVGLLNICEEAIKGSEVIKRSGELLRSAANNGDLNFYGNIEGNDIFKGTTDIVVCDGFVGNVLLKTTEGLADDRLIAIRESHDKLMGMRGFAGFDHFFFTGVFTPVTNVVPDRPAEQDCVLGHQGDLAVQAVEPNVFDVMAVHREPSGGRVIKSM